MDPSNQREHPDEDQNQQEEPDRPLSIAGIVITTVSGLSIAGFLLMELAGAVRNPYVGLVAYVILPAIFVVGLLVMPETAARSEAR